MKNEKFTFFYHSQNPFSQWFLSDFELEGHQFNCAEQYMMYRKAVLFGDEAMKQKILEAKHPRKQKAYGRLVQNFDAEIWNKKAKEIVYEANHAKFTQNKELEKYLLKTAGSTLVEASPSDVIWGIGMSDKDPDRFDRKKWRGKNWLGEVLTKLRDDLLAVVA